MPAPFDLDTYFKRIGYAGPRTPTLSTLKAIHALQPATIPFENLDPFLQRPVRLDLTSLQGKLVAQRRGGYCFELNTLFAAALEAVGFPVTRLAGWVRWMAPPERPEGPRTHMTLRVDLDEGSYLADVGFGSHLQAAPIRLQRDVEQETPASRLRLTGVDPNFILQALLPKGWHDVYRFTLDPQQSADYEVANWFTSTSPASLFYANFLAERLTADYRVSMNNTRLTRRRSDGATDHRTLAGAEEFAETLETVFGIAPPVDPALIWNRLPKG